MNEELIANTINNLTERVSQVLLEEFLKLPGDLQLNVVLIKTAQLLLANILCHVASTNEELEKIAGEQGVEVKELTINCALSAFTDKFDSPKH
jgi:hypothetical protein